MTPTSTAATPLVAASPEVVITFAEPDRGQDNPKPQVVTDAAGRVRVSNLDGTRFGFAALTTEWDTAASGWVPAGGPAPGVAAVTVVITYRQPGPGQRNPDPQAVTDRTGRVRVWDRTINQYGYADLDVEWDR